LETSRKFREHTVNFFNLPKSVKYGIRRSEENSRGFFDDEFTKRKRDWKEGLDFGVTPLCLDPKASGFTLDGIPDDDPRHSNLDGFNRFPSEVEAPGFRRAMWDYFRAMTALAERVAGVMALGMGVDRDFFAEKLKDSHSSFLRLNYYPILHEDSAAEKPLGISPHTVFPSQSGLHPRWRYFHLMFG